MLSEQSEHDSNMYSVWYFVQSKHKHDTNTNIKKSL